MTENNSVENNKNEQSISFLDRVPFWQNATFFLLGFLALSLCASLYKEVANFLINKGVIDLVIDSLEYKTWMNFFAYLPIFIIALFVIGKTLYKVLWQQVKSIQLWQEGLTFAGILIFGSSFIGAIFTAIGKSCGLEYGVNANEEQIRASIQALPVASFCFVVLFAPVVEELTYRVGFFGILQKFNKHLAYILSTLLFGLIHFNFDAKAGNDMYVELLNLPSYLFAGFTLTFAYARSGSFVSSWFPHALNNLLSFLSSISRTVEGA